MTPQKLVVLVTSLTGGAIGLFAPIGVVKWLLQAEPEDAGILTLFFFPVWCLLFVLGLLIGRGWDCSSRAANGSCKDSGAVWCVRQEVSNYLARNDGEQTASSRYFQRRRDSLRVKSQESKPQ